MVVPTWYYEHHDGDFKRDVPEEAFGGWKKADLEISREHTAVVSMHAWETCAYGDYPGWWRCVPYIPRAHKILADVYPRLFGAVRESGMTLLHVVGGGDYYKKCPGYKHAVELAGPEPVQETVPSDPVRDALVKFKADHVHPGAGNLADVQRGVAKLDFAEQARPRDDEGVAENSRQLYALCKEKGINHLVYCGFAIDWCLLMSPGGMVSMQPYGLLCSAFRQATTAVENKQSARGELCKEIGLWRVALAYGFVFDVDDFIRALKG